MDYWKNVKKAHNTNGHGECNFFLIVDGFVDTDGMERLEPEESGFVVGHSEGGHHHVVERDGVTMKRGSDSRGFEILHAIVTKPALLKQLAGVPHGSQVVVPGEYLITKNIETSPFTKQARRVAD